MKYCIYCGQELSDGAKFCSKCGKSQDSKSEASQDLSFINNEEYLKAPEGKEKYLSLVERLYSYFNSISDDYQKYDELIEEIAGLEGCDFDDAELNALYNGDVAKYFSDICYKAEIYARKIDEHYEKFDLAQLIDSPFTNPNIIFQIKWLIMNGYADSIDDACAILNGTTIGSSDSNLQHILRIYLLGQIAAREKGLPEEETAIRAAFFPKGFFDKAYGALWKKDFIEKHREELQNI